MRTDGLATPPLVVMPFVWERLRPEVRAFAKRVGARLVPMVRTSSYWDLLGELWTGERDFLLWEEDVLPSADLIEGMTACTEELCSGTFGRWYYELVAGRRVLKSDSWLGLVRFSAGLQRRVPDALILAAERFPDRHWGDLCRGLMDRGVLDAQQGLSPHLHFPHMLHRGQPLYPDPWDDAHSGDGLDGFNTCLAGSEAER
jgi:hypothetical protein